VSVILPLPPTGDQSAGKPICTACRTKVSWTGIVQRKRWGGRSKGKMRYFIAPLAPMWQSRLNAMGINGFQPLPPSGEGWDGGDQKGQEPLCDIAPTQPPPAAFAALRPLGEEIKESLRDGVFECGFSHPRARYFLLRRQKKVTKEKATRLPLKSRGTSMYLALRAAVAVQIGNPANLSCAPELSTGVARRDIPIPLATRGIHSAPLRVNPAESRVLGAADGP